MTEPSEESSAAPETTDKRRQEFWNKVAPSIDEIWENALDHYTFEEIKEYLNGYPDLTDLFEDWYAEWSEDEERNG